MQSALLSELLVLWKREALSLQSKSSTTGKSAKSYGMLPQEILIRTILRGWRVKKDLSVFASRLVLIILALIRSPI